MQAARTTVLDDANHDGSVDPPLGRVLRTGWRWLLVASAIGLAAGFLLLAVLPKQYTSDASVLVRPVQVLDSAGTSTAPAEVNLDTEAQLVKSLVVAEAAAKKLGTQQSPDDVLSHVSVTVPPNTSILDIGYQADAAADAQAGASAVADAYLKARRGSAENAVDSLRSRLDQQAHQLQVRLGQLTRAVADAEVGSPERLALSTKLRLLQSRLSAVQANQVQLGSSQVSPGELVSPADLPTGPSSPSPRLILASSLALGLLAGILLAWVTRWRRAPLLSTREVAEFGATPLLGVCGPHDLEAESPARGVRDLVIGLASQHDDLLLVPAARNQSSLGPGLVVGQQLSPLVDQCILVVGSDDLDQLADWYTDTRGLKVQGVDAADRPLEGDAGPTQTLFVAPRLPSRGEQPLGGVDFGVVTVHAGRTTAAQLRRTVSRLEARGVTVRGVLLDRGALGDEQVRSGRRRRSRPAKQPHSV